MKRLQHLFLIALISFAVGSLTSAATTAATAPRERLLMDFGWKFHLGNDWGIGENLAKAGSGAGPASVVFSDASWRQLDLPHDWAIELPFDPKGDAGHGFKALGEGFPQNSIGWYRRTFTLPATDAGRRIWLEFDGAFRDCTVFVNGWHVGRHESGYSNFRFDITDVANCGGANVVAVRVDATQTEGWFYEGAGIYRHVWLVKTAPLAVAPDGIFVFSRFKDNLPAGAATLHLQTRLLNSEANDADATVTWEVFGPGGKALASVHRTGRIGGSATADFEESAPVAVPELWSPETPRLYKLVTTVTRGGATVDRLETEFGIRTVGFDQNQGFLLNGQPYVLKGTCNHQDHAGVGVAVPDALQYFRIARLKEMGSNAYRSAHNPPTPAVLEACDRLGMLVMDESRLLGSNAANLDRLDRLVRRDRNHASVAIWSLANEEFDTQGTPAGKRTAATMQALIKRLDTTRPITYNSTLPNEYAGINEVIEVRGWSYRIGVDRMDAYHAAHPQQPNVGSEQGSTITTRGIYATDPVRGYMSAYDDNQTDWSNTAKQWWGFFAPRPWLSGGFVWTGFDYRGEPTPYQWPDINSHFGILDTCGFPKDNFWLYQSWWTAKPMVHVLPHWNWAGREGQEIDVRAYSNGEEVELFLNGQSLGRQKMAPASEQKWKVKYAPGALSAKAFRGGAVVAETKVETTGAPAAVQLTPDRASVDADGRDVAVYTVAITDAQGRVVPTAANRVVFSLDGPGQILGVGNGDPACHEPDVFIGKAASHARPIDGWRLKKGIDVYAPTVPEIAESVDDSRWEKVDVRSESGPLGLNERGVFRTKLNVTAKDLSAPALELWFGKIDGGGFVFINGKQIAPAGNSRAASVFDAKAFLHPGDNTIAIGLANYGATGGVNLGAELRFQDKPAAVEWSRSVFNGLAQIIIRTVKEPGTLKLTATSDGLAAAIVSVTTKAVPPEALLP